ncbi:MAG: gliding motility-associated-like protein [Patiriisocius sp.]|jgi:gliding motility-associated-like protein
MLKRLLIVALVSTLFYTDGHAQLVVSSDMTPEWYVQNILLDPDGGVEASNVTYNGATGDTPNNQCGMFDGANSNIELCDGIILASGGVEGAEGANESGSTTTPVDVSVNGDADLFLASGFAMNDVAVLEFDFVPNGDTLRFNYIFGSDEYPEFVDSFNDAFGFFMCGPGLSGPYSTPDDVIYPDGSANVALIPGTELPVTINNVNDGDNAEYYVPNGDGGVPPFSTDDFYIEYDGLTVTLQAIVPLIPGETYHIKFAIADAVDSAFDSGVFLEGGSFTTGDAGISVLVPNLNYTNPTLIEASTVCDTGYFSIFRDDCILDSLWYEFDYSGGTADYGVDYLPLPLDTVIAEGVTLLEYPMFAIPDAEDEGVETIEVLVYTSQTGQAGSFVFQDTLFIDIVENYTFALDAPTKYIWCPGDSINLVVEANAPGIELFEYTWTQNGEVLGENSSQLLVPIPPNFMDSTYYDINVIDGCGMTSVTDSVWIVNVIPPDPTAIVEVNGEYCRGIDFPISAILSGGTYPFTYDWSDGGNTNPNYVTPSVVTEYTVIVTDGCGRVSPPATGSFPMPEPVVVSEDLQDYICLDEVLELSPEVTGGQAPYDFAWGFDQTFGVVEYDETTGNGTVEVLSQLLDPEEDVVQATLIVKDYCQVQRELLDINDPIDQPVEYTDTIVLLNCIVPNVITPNGDSFNNLFKAEELLAKKGTMFIYDRWGKLLSESSRHTWNADDNSDGTYFYVVAFDDGEIKKGSFTILR